jgi:anti-sigma regulatory factor (Ser/Thr protein kinase)
MRARLEVRVVHEPAIAPGSFTHLALFYNGKDDYVSKITSFLREGLDAGHPAFVAVPTDRLGWLQDALGPDAAAIRFADMAAIGRNPGRITSEIREFVDSQSGQHVRCVGEPIWQDRSVPEVREATRHETLLNLAFDDASVAILCPYDSASLDPAVLADAERTHPTLVWDGEATSSPAYGGPWKMPDSCTAPLAPEPDGAMTITYTRNLSAVREFVAERARAAKLPESKIIDLVLAVSELAANTVRHTGLPGTLDMWQEDREIICMIRDKGTITDPLAGRRRPGLGGLNGHGLWLVHQVCDLVELRSDSSGTTIRLHMAIPRC